MIDNLPLPDFKVSGKANIKFYNRDCMKVMAGIGNNSFDLAIIDPPYGIDVANDSRFGKMASKKSATITKDYTSKDWDKSIPSTAYWDELFRISKNQIIWGVNYFTDDRFKGGRIFWYKNVPEDYTKSKGEIAYKSFGIGVDFIDIVWHGMLQYDMKNKENRIHPTQKPILLYRYLLKKYTKKGDKIIDTHLGSASIALACWEEGIDMVGIEISEEYFKNACKRLSQYTDILTLF